MRCVKTGLTFQVPSLFEGTFHGDMFLNQEIGIYIIRGIANQTSDYPPDITLYLIGDAFAIDKIKESFAECFEQFNEHDIRLDVDEPIVIIDDTRFF